MPRCKIKLFLVGFYIFTIGVCFMSIPGIPIFMNRFIQLIGINLILLVFIKRMSYRGINGYLGLIFCLFILWQIIIIARDDKFSLWNFQRYLFTPGYLLYLAPIMIYKIADLSNFKYILFLVLCLYKTFVFFIVLLFPFIIMGGNCGLNCYESLNASLATATLFGILIQKYLNKEGKRWLFVASILALIIALILGRRSIIITYLVTIVFYQLYRYKYVLVSFKHKLKVVLVWLFIGVSLFLFLKFLGPVLFGRLFDRMMDDTRCVVELSFFADIIPGSYEFWVGRGISGTYYAPGIEENGTDYREHIESGYLELILKGGGTFVLLYLLLTIPAVILGLFYSKNNFCRLAAIYCIIYSGFLYGIGSYFSFGIRYLLLIYCVLICYKKTYRGMSDYEISNIIK